MEYELTHESLSAEREKMIREKKERAEKHDKPAAMRLAQVGGQKRGEQSRGAAGLLQRVCQEQLVVCHELVAY